MLGARHGSSARAVAVRPAVVAAPVRHATTVRGRAGSVTDERVSARRRGDLALDTRTLDPGHHIHWYRIESVLGQGGFGVTYLAHDTNLDRRVAIKEYLPTTIAARDADDSVRPLSEGKRDDFTWGLDNFLAEARTLARFSHENIVGVHSVFEENSTAYMVMAYEEGDSLSSLYRRGEYRDQAALERVFFPIFEGLREIHRLGFVHRDIKPANIYIRENGTAVLLDFGAARLMVQQQTGEMTSLVSQGYTPLEQYSVSYGEQGPWTDIYALAATMYEGVAGVRPEEALSRSACLLRRRPDPVVALSDRVHPGFDERFLDAVTAGLALQPEERPADLDVWLARFGRERPAVSPGRFAEFDELDERTRLRPRRHTDEDDDRTRLRGVAPPPPSPPSEPSIARAPAASAAARDAAAPRSERPGDERRTVAEHPSSGAGEGATRRAERTPARAPSADVRPPPAVPAEPFPFESGDLDPPTYRAGTRGARRSTAAPDPRDAEPKRRERPDGWLPKALAALVLLGVVAGGSWWYVGGGPAGDDGVAMPDPTVVASLPPPPGPLSVASRETEIVERLDAMSRLAALYGDAEAEGAASASLADGARALRDELGELALAWHPERHATIVARIESVAAMLPESVADRSALQRAIASADERSDLDAARALLESNAIVEPVGAALIDRIGRLGREDYREITSSGAWRHMIGTIGAGALERVRAEAFDDASLLVRAGLTLQPDEPFLQRLGEHLGGG